MAERPANQSGPSTTVSLIVVIVILFCIDGVANDGKVGDFIFSFFPTESNTSEASTETTDHGSAILASAQKLDSERYVWGGGHPPAAFSKGKGVDCSGLINVAVKQATGISEDNVARGFRSSKHWSSIAAKDAAPGDIMYQLKEKHNKTVDHVVIVVKNEGDGKLTVFEASTSNTSVAKQVRERAGVSYGEFDGTLRFKK